LSCNEGLIPEPPEEITVTFPGGLTIKSAPNPAQIVTTDFAAVQSIMAQLAPALAGLQPMLMMIDAMVSLFAVMQKAPEIPVDPSGFVEALQEAAEKIAKVSAIIPALSVPKLALDTIGACARYLQAILAQLEDVVEQSTSAAQLMAQAQADGDTQLQAEAQCAVTNAERMQAHAVAALGPLGSVLDSVTALMGFLPSPKEMPGLPSTDGLGAQELIDALQPVVDVLVALT
jgi:hypothetical protein